MKQRFKPYRKRKPYRRKQGGGKYMLRGTPSTKVAPTKDVVLSQLFSGLAKIFKPQGRRMP